MSAAISADGRAPEVWVRAVSGAMVRAEAILSLQLTASDEHRPLAYRENPQWTLSARLAVSEGSGYSGDFYVGGEVPLATGAGHGDGHWAHDLARALSALRRGEIDGTVQLEVLAQGPELEHDDRREGLLYMTFQQWPGPPDLPLAPTPSS